jgi:hypothetical protein
MAPSPGRVLGLVRLLERLPGRRIDRRELARLIHPTAPPAPGEPEPRDVREVIEAARQVGLVEELDGKPGPVVRLHVNLPAEAAAALPVLLAERALRPEIDRAPNLFARACAWLLVQAPFDCPQGHDGLRLALQRDGFDLDQIDLRNTVRIDMLLYWARYLGLIERIRESNGAGLVPDPTEYLRRHLDRLLPDERPVASPAFRERLGQLCPVLDGGSVRAAVLEYMHRAGAPRWPDGQLSDALSLALRKLQSEGLLHWTYRDDARTFLDLSRRERVSAFRRGPDPRRSQS